MDKKIGQKIVRWYQKNKVSLPWREKWVETKDPYVVWVSEIMLQQTQIKTVVPKYQSFIKNLPTVEHLASASEEVLRQLTSGLGYYRRFRMLHQAAKVLSEARLDFPNTLVGLKELPGVGEYTAHAVGSICFDLPLGVVDGNVERVLSRLEDYRGAPNTPEMKKVFKDKISKILHEKKPGDFNQGIMELGQRICTPRNPSCEACVLQSNCQSFAKDSQHLSPGKKLRQQKKLVSVDVLVYQTKDKIGLIERAEESRFLRNTRGFLNQHSINQSDEHLGEFSHTITNHKITAKVFLVNEPAKKMVMVPKSTVLDMLQTSFDRKVFGVLQPKNRKPSLSI